MYVDSMLLHCISQLVTHIYLNTTRSFSEELQESMCLNLLSLWLQPTPRQVEHWVNIDTEYLHILIAEYCIWEMQTSVHSIKKKSSGVLPLLILVLSLNSLKVRSISSMHRTDWKNEFLTCFLWHLHL